jgi:calcineurin-like phosphoesterase family protein
VASFITADFHLNHQNILKYCNRPYGSVEEMEDGIVAEVCSKVKNDDIVYHLGDFLFNAKYTEFERIFDRLPGKWCFVLGNHDRHTIELWSESLKRNGRILDITHLKRLVYENKLCILSHYEMKAWEGKEWRYKKNYKYDCAYHFFGHYHNKPFEYETDTAEVGLDTTDMKLLTIEEHMARAGIKKAIDTSSNLI